MISSVSRLQAALSPGVAIGDRGGGRPVDAEKSNPVRNGLSVEEQRQVDVPVSYTHLDVYKRQVELAETGAPAKAFLKRCILLLGTFTIERLQELDQLEVIVDEAACGQNQTLLLDLASKFRQLPIAGAHVE